MNRQALRRRIVVGTATTFLGNGWAMVVTLVSLPILLHGLGAEEFGLWALLQTLSAVSGWTSLIHTGIGTAITRAVAAADSADDAPARGRKIGTGLALLAACAVIAGGLLAVVGPVTLPRLFGASAAHVDALRVAILIFAVQTAAEVIIEGIESCLEGLQRVDISRAIDAIRRTLMTALACAAAASGRGLVGVAAGACIGTGAGLAVGGALFLLVARGKALRVSRAEVGALLRASRSIAVLRPLGVAERTMDRIVVGALLGPSLVALVEVATQVANGAAAILSASAYSVVPAASWLDAREDSRGLRALLDRGTGFSIAVTLPVIAIAAIVSGPALRLWVGSDAALTATLLALASIAMVAPLQVGSELLVGTNRAGLVLRAAAGALTVNLVATSAFVHVVGVPGAFLGTITADLFLIPLLARAFLAQVDERPWDFVRRSVLPVALPLLGLCAAALAVSLLPLADLERTALSAAAGVLAYVVTLTLGSARRGRPLPRLVQLLSER